MMRAAWLFSTFAVIVALGAACDKSRTATKPTPLQPTGHSQMTGVFVGVAQNGRIDVAIETASLASALGARGAPAAAETVVTASATMSPDGGGAIILTGTYNNTNDSLHLTGQGYVLGGRYLPSAAPARVEGRYSSPSDSGSFLTLPGAAATVSTFCATYENADATMWGTIDLAISGPSIAGFEVMDGAIVVRPLAGTVTGSGTTRTLAFAGNPFTGTGTWNAVTGHVEGTWTAGIETGIWSGERCLSASTGAN